MRRTNAVLAVLLLAACQRGDSFHSTPEQPTITKTKAYDIAVAGTVKPGDVPGYKLIDVGESTAFEINPTECVKFPTPYVTIREAGYERGELLILSGVHVAPTIERIRENYLQMLDNTLIPCVKQQMANEAVGDGYELTDIAVRRFDVLVRQSDGGFGTSLRATARKGDFRLGLHYVTVNAIVDHAEILIMGIGAGRDAPSEATLKALLAKAVKRARAAV